jgi:aminotransferase
MLAALQLDESYYQELKDDFLSKRDFIISALTALGFEMKTPQGAYYLMADYRNLGFTSDEEAVNVLLERAKVATVAGGAFYIDPSQGQHLLRFCFALDQHKLQLAVDNLRTALA